MNPRRDIIRRGAVAVRGSEIAAVGPESDLRARYEAASEAGGDRFVATPGMVNSHIHITGEPLTRGYVPDDIDFAENVFGWLCPLYASYTAADERISAQLAATEMLRSGTTCFLEAGTVRFLDEVIDGLAEAGIRGRVGRGPPRRSIPAVGRRGRSPASRAQGSVSTCRRRSSTPTPSWPSSASARSCTSQSWACWTTTWH